MRGDSRNAPLAKPLEVILTTASVQAALRQHPLLKGLLVTAAGFSAQTPRNAPGRENQADQAVFIYCVKGVGWCETRGRLHTVRSGDLLVLGPGASCTTGTRGANGWTIHWVQAAGAHVGAYLSELKVEADAPVLRVGDDPQVARLFGEILRSLQRGPSLAHCLRASSAMAYALALLIQKRHETAPEDSDMVRKIAETIIFMSEHVDEPLRVSTLARLASFSPAYFAELFKKQTGCSPRDYLHLLRIHRACQLLQGTALNVKEIAGRVGYQDQFHFSRQFKAFQGLSPSEYRESRPR